MKTRSRHALAFLSTVLLTVSLGAGAAPPPSSTIAHPQPAKVSIGIPVPQAQLGQGSSEADLGEPFRQSLIARLRGSGFDLVPLQSRDARQVDAEAADKHVTYVLYSRVEQKHGGSGIGGMFKKLAPLANMLPMVGGRMGGMGGGALASAAASTMAQSAASASAEALQRDAMAQLTGGQQSSIKNGDVVTLEYRLVAPGSNSPVGASTLQGKAKSDGEDVLSPLVEQLAGAVTTAATSSFGPGATGPAAAGAGTASPPPGTANPPAAENQDPGHSSRGVGGLGGLFGRHKPPASATAANADANSIDCAKIATIKEANMSLESCEKMKGAGVAYNQAAADPSASRPGDDRMTCEQIAAELKQQSYTAPDKAKSAEAQSAVAADRAALAKDQAEVAKTVAAQQAAVDAASAADHATMLATGGLVDPNRAGKLAETFSEQDHAMGERMNEARRPTDTRMVNSTADIAGDMGQQLTANPRLAKLIQMSHDRKCKRI